MWSGAPISLRIFHNFIVIHTVKGFSIVNEAEVDVCLEFPCFFYDPGYVDNLSLVPLPFLNPSVHLEFLNSSTAKAKIEGFRG